MNSGRQTIDSRRLEALRGILNRARNETLARVREFRHEQEDDALPLPSDEMDAARSLAEVETHASLIDRAEFRLKAIDAAFARLEQGRYGICEACGEEIAIERLAALPFAAYCVDCQKERRERVSAGEGAVDAPSLSRWKIPEELDESIEREDTLEQPEEKLAVRERTPFGPEAGEFQQLPPVPTARRRGTIKRRRESEG
jgi:RNA polymerase-binding transcription factor